MVLQSMGDATALLVQCGEDTNQGITLEVIPMATPFDSETVGIQHADGDTTECPLRFIQEFTAESAVSLMKYFIRQKKHMSGYMSASDAESAVESLQLPQPQLEPSDEHVVAKKILLASGSKVNLAAFKQIHRKVGTNTVNAACELLQDLQLGKLVHERQGGRGRHSSCLYCCAQRRTTMSNLPGNKSSQEKPGTTRC